MARLGRDPRPAPEPAGDASTTMQLAALIACHDQALALVDHLLRTATPGGVRQLVDGLLDIRLKLRPPPPAQGP